MDLIQDRKINLVRLSPLYLVTRILYTTKKFSGCGMEIEHILAKSACFRTPVNIQEMTIHPLHHEHLGIDPSPKWRPKIQNVRISLN